MSKLVAAINISLDGFCDHTAGIPDEEILSHYTELLSGAAVILYGRTTYQLMESYWPGVVEKPTGDKAADDFALMIEKIPKIVFSTTLKDAGWKNASLANGDLKDVVLQLKQRRGNDVLVGSPGLISSLTKLGLVDEYQLCVHPVIVGTGLRLFKDVADKIILKRLSTKHFGSGAMMSCYEPIKA